jgi:hypothetical protein
MRSSIALGPLAAADQWAAAWFINHSSSHLTPHPTYTQDLDQFELQVQTTAIMIVDQFQDVLKKTSLLPIPTATPTSVSPIPSFVHDSPDHQFVGDAGKKTLWVVFVLMIIASATFTGLSWRVPLVSIAARLLLRFGKLTTTLVQAPLSHHYHHHYPHRRHLVLRHGHW